MIIDSMVHAQLPHYKDIISREENNRSVSFHYIDYIEYEAASIRDLQDLDFGNL